MPITYRTSGAWGSGKGANLTPNEVDVNFNDLDTRVTSIEDNPPQPNDISNIQVVGTQMTIFLQDATEFGPFTLPTATIRFQGDWVPATNYFQLDVVNVSGLGTYIILEDHISDATFDPTREESAGLLYERLIAPQTTPVSPVTGTTFTPTLADANTYMRCTNSSGVTVTIPPNSSVPYDLTTELHFRQATTGGITFVEGSGVVINGINGFELLTDAQGSAVTLKKVATDEWDIFGLLAESAT